MPYWRPEDHVSFYSRCLYLGLLGLSKRPVTEMCRFFLVIPVDRELYKLYKGTFIRRFRKGIQ
jgi:hypothetical protein